MCFHHWLQQTNYTTVTLLYLEFWKRVNDSDVWDRKVSGTTVDRSLVPILIDLRFQENDITFFKWQLGRIFGVKVVERPAGWSNRGRCLAMRKGRTWKGRGRRLAPSFFECRTVLGSSRETDGCANRAVKINRINKLALIFNLYSWTCQKTVLPGRRNTWRCWNKVGRGRLRGETVNWREGSGRSRWPVIKWSATASSKVIVAVGSSDAKIFKCFRPKFDFWLAGSLVGLFVELDSQIF